MFNSSANTLLECIARNTSLLAVKHAALIKYLGEKCPLYANDIKDSNNILNNNYFIKNKIKMQKNILNKIDKSMFALEDVINSI